MKLTIHLSPEIPEAEAQLLSYQEGNSWVRIDTTGRDSIELQFEDPVQSLRLETLRRDPKRPGAFLSHVQTAPLEVRGMTLLAGHPDDPGKAEGTSIGARWVEAPDLLSVPVTLDGQAEPGYLAIQGNALRLISAAGRDLFRIGGDQAGRVVPGPAQPEPGGCHGQLPGPSGTDQGNPGPPRGIPAQAQAGRSNSLGMTVTFQAKDPVMALII
jgi:hypothetical protein